MNYMIFAIDANAQEFLFIFEYAKGDNTIVLGEVIKLNNLCYIKNFDFDFFEIVEDPNYILNKEGIYIDKYYKFSDVINKLQITLTKEEIADLKIKNKEIFELLTKKNKDEILSIVYNDVKYSELLKKMFEVK